jgi:hypothetical protein
MGTGCAAFVMAGEGSPSMSFLDAGSKVMDGGLRPP